MKRTLNNLKIVPLGKRIEFICAIGSLFAGLAMFSLAAFKFGANPNRLDVLDIVVTLYVAGGSFFVLTGFVLFNGYVSGITDLRLQGLANYVEGLREYTVSSFTSVKDDLKNIDLEEIPIPPPIEVPTEQHMDRPPLADRDTLLKIIGALLKLLAEPRSGTSNTTTVINSLIELYPKTAGLSERNLQKKFAEAKQRLLSD